MISIKIINGLVFFIIIAISITSNAISVSVSSICEDTTNSYNFDSLSYDPEIIIEFSSITFNPDFTVKVVDNINDADIVVEDNVPSLFKVCESRNGKTVKISNYTNNPDLTVKISNYNYGDPDFTIFNKSKILNIEEVISVLIVPSYSIVDLN